MIAFFRALRLYFPLMYTNPCNQFSSQASHLQPLHDSDSHSSGSGKCEHVFVTHIRATNVASGLRRMPAGFHVIVEVDGRIMRTSSKSVSTAKDAVEWDEDVLLPSDQSSSISFSVYASFELGPKLGNGELLGEFRIGVGELFHHQDEQLQLVDLTAQEGDILPSCSSLNIVVERRICDTNESCPKLDLPESPEMDALERLTDEGHHALLRYRLRQDQMDLDAAIQTFERVQEICPIDYPNRSVVLFNLANARFIDCRANNRYLNLDTPIGLYRDALQLRSKDHPDHCTTVLELGLALLMRFQRRGLEADREEAKELLGGVVEASATASDAYRAGLFALQMTEASASEEAGDAGSLSSQQMNDEDVIQEKRDLLQNLSYSNPRRLALLVDLGVLLSNRFERNEVLADVHEAISMFEHAMDLVPDGYPDMLYLLDDLGIALSNRFNHVGDLADINRSISMLDEAVCLTPDSHADKPSRLSNLGKLLLRRFKHVGDLADINKSISTFEEAVRLSPNDHPDKLYRLSDLGSSLFRRFQRLGDLGDLNRSIAMREEAVCLTADGHPDRSACLNNFGNSLFLRFERLGDLIDLNKSIAMREETVCLTPDGHPDKPCRLYNLGNSLLNRFQRLNDLADLNRSISMKEEAVCLIPDGHPDKPAWLNDLGRSFFIRFECLRDLADLNKAISMRQEAVCLLPDGHADRPAWLNNLGNTLLKRFQRIGDIADLDKSISIFEESVSLTVDDHPDKPGRLGYLGNSFLCRFQRLGDLADLNQSILKFEEVVHLTPDDHADKPSWLNNLGSSLLSRFQQLGDLVDLMMSISMFEEAVSLTADGHPDKPSRLSNLGCSLSCSFQSFGDLVDLNRSISLLDEAVCLMRDDDPGRPTPLNTLGTSLLDRFQRLGDLADLNKSVSVREEAVRLTADIHPNKPCRLSNLGGSLFRRFQRLGDLADLNRSILTREEAVCLTPDDHPEKPRWLNNLGNSLLSRFQRLDDLGDLNRSISISEEAVSLSPNGSPNKPGRLTDLGNSLLNRFQRLGDLADLNRSILMKEEAVCLTADGHPDKPAWLNNLGCSLSRRFKLLGDLADLNRSISMFEEAIRLTPEDHSEKPSRLNNLGNSLLRRFERLGAIKDLIRSISKQEQAICLLPDDHSSKPVLLDTLGNALLSRFMRLGDLVDLNRSISVREEAVCLTPDGHPDKPGRLSNLGSSLYRRFEHLGNHADIVKSISIKQDAITLTPDGHPDKPTLLVDLGDAFNIRFKHFHDSFDLSAASSNYSAASRASVGRVATRFHATRSWISCAQLQENTMALLDACACALDLLPQLAWLGLPVTERHRLLVQAADVTRDAVAAALNTGNPELAVEWLEQGRSIVWTQFLQLRTPIDDLADMHPTIAHQFREISQELEHASARNNPTFDQSAGISVSDTRLLEKDIQRHQDLALRRENLLGQIRSLPGFDRFLLPKTVKQLAALAISGPVVYLTASKERCDALIVTAGSESVLHVPLPAIRYKDMDVLRRLLRAMLEQRSLVFPRDSLYELLPSEDMNLSKEFLDFLLGGDFTGNDGSDWAAKTKPRLGGPAAMKPERFEEYTPNELYQMILKHLWVYVVNPVLQVLGFSSPPSANDKMTRIFWCPTGPFSFLPIHAAGLYHDTAEAGIKLSDFAISSYLPVLSSLVSSSRKNLDRPSPKLRLLAVPQPPTDGLSKLSAVKREINYITELSNKSSFVILEDSDGTVEDVMDKLRNSDWVHFACHGIQDPKKPLDSGLCLANNHRLKLSDIMKLSRPKGGLAFLSACQTAQGDEMLSEESVHLAAGMLLAGYGSVVGTMWSMMDSDGPKVAKDVYGHLFRDAGRVPESTEAAAALHYAIQHLRDSDAPFSSWVPFIHFGR